MSLLQTSQLTKRFGGILAVNQVDLEVGAGEICGLIGPNGSGKTTVLNLITGIYAPTDGAILFQGRPIQGRAPHDISILGIARSFQNIRLLPSLSVFDNVRLGAHIHTTTGLWGILLRSAGMRAEEAAIASRIDEMLEFVGLQAVRDEIVRNLPYGRQKVLEIARALMVRPKLLLLDEPAAGLNSAEKAQLMTLVGKIRDTGVAILLIEHEMAFVEGLSDRVYVLNYGKKISQGSFAEIQRDPAVIEAYLGAGGSRA